MGLNWADHTVEIEAPIETCFDAIVDYESFPGWQSAVTSTEVQSRTKDGIGERVTLHLSTKGQKVDYTLLYRYQRPELIEWDFVEGHGVDDVDGHYSFEDLGDGRTRATYKLGVDPSLPVPGIVARRIHKSALESSVEELKTEAEKRHAEGYEPKKPKRRFGPLGGAGKEPEPDQEPAASEPEPAPEPAPAPTAATDDGGEQAAQAEPASHLERAASTGRDVAEGAVRAGIGVAGGAFGLARGAAGTAVGLGRGAAGAVTGRISKLLDRDYRR